MKLKYPNLQKAMRERKVTVGDLSRVTGVSEEIIYLKLQGIREWSILEATAICRYLQYPDLKTLFLR